MLKNLASLGLGNVKHADRIGTLNRLLDEKGEDYRGIIVTMIHKFRDMPADLNTRDNIYVRHSRVVDPSTSQCVPDDQRERYRLRKDPFELHNQCFGGSSASCPVGDQQLDLELRLSQLRNCAGIAGRDERVDGRPFCE